MNPSDYIAISSALIAGLALAVTFWQLSVARKHNMLSVKPHLNINLSLYPAEPVTFTLVNVGVGPAFVDKCSILLDGREYDPFDPDGIHKLISHIGLDPEKIAWKGTALSKGASILPGNAHCILEFTQSVNDQDVHEKLRQVAPRIDLDVTYKCVYGNDFDVNTPL